MCGTLILAFFLFAVGGGLAQSTTEVRVDLTRDLGVFPPVYRWFGYDESNYTTTKNGEALLHELHDLTPQPVYVRAHFLLTTGNGKPELKWSSSNVYSEDANGKPIYDWAILDRIFDAWVGAHVRPFVELGFMPKALSSHPDPYHIPWPTKPGDVEGWSISSQGLREMAGAGAPGRGAHGCALRHGGGLDLVLGGVERARYFLLARD